MARGYGAYPTFYREVRSMGPKILWQRKNAVAVARKAGVVEGVDGASFLGRTLGTFSQTNGPTGYALSYGAGDTPFPDDTASMTTRVDLTGLSEMRLLATVASGGDEDVLLVVTGGGEDATVVLESVSGGHALRVGMWHAVMEQGEVDLEWKVLAPSGGSATLGLVQLQGRGTGVGAGAGGGGGDPLDNPITFGLAPPGRLTEEGGQYYADYEVLSGNYGYSDSQATSIVDSVLQSASGWGRAGITFRNVGAGAPVSYVFVNGPMDCGGVRANGCTTPIGGGAEVWINYNRAVSGYARNLISHESGHAFFGARHDGGGIMAGDSPDGWPTDSDVASVVDWLGV